MALLEMLLFHELPATGTIEVSATSSTGPWTTLTLTSTLPVSEALSEWTTAANTALPSRSWDFFHNGDQVYFDCTGGNGWVQLPPGLADLLGFSSAVLEAHNTATADQTALGLLDLPVGRTMPFDREESELEELRGGRVATRHYGRALEVTLELYVAPDLWAAVEESPIVSGHAAFRVTGDNTSPFGEGDLDGALTVYPIGSPSLEREGPEDYAQVTLLCSLEEP